MKISLERLLVESSTLWDCRQQSYISIMTAKSVGLSGQRMKMDVDKSECCVLVDNTGCCLYIVHVCVYTCMYI